MSSFEDLIVQIDAFIRKYYKNEMLKGLILFVGFLLLSFLCVISLEYFGRFNSVVRAVMFFSFLGVNLFLAVKYLVLPLSKLFSFGKRINRVQAAEVIGSFFPEISDRLLNTLQLNDTMDQDHVNYELIRASVFQRSKTLSVVPFSHGINLKQNWVYVKYVAPILLLFVLVAFFFPRLISQGTERVVNYNTEFKPEAPFEFIVQHTAREIQEGEDFPVELLLKGSEIPDKVYLVSSGGKFLMKKQSKVSSFYVLKRLKEQTDFYFEANGFRSSRHSVKVIPRSALGRFQAKLTYPAYLGKQNETINNVGDLMIPTGTKVEWSVLTKNVDRTKMAWSDTAMVFTNEGFLCKRGFYKSTGMAVVLFNKHKNRRDSLKYQIDVIPDNYPSIEVSEELDSISEALRFFEGQITDDYGLKSLKFVYKITSKDGSVQDFSVNLQAPVGTAQPFRHAVDFRREKLKVDDKVEYYFTVYDNDGVNGSKATRSKTFVYELPSLDELNDKRDLAQEQAKQDMNKLLNRTETFKKDIQRLKKEVLNSKSTDWNQMNQVQQLKEERNDLQQQLEQMQQQMEESVMEKNQLSEMDKELLEKQEMLQELLNEVMDDELKALLEKLEELMKKQDRDELDKNMDQLDMKAEDMNKQLDRSLEMLKKMQVNEKIDDIVKELRELSKEQNELEKELESGKKSEDEVLKEQEKLSEKFEALKEEMKEMKELNEDLKRPMNLGDQEDLKKEVDDQMSEAKDNLSKGKEKKAGENQKKSAEKMDEMADELEQMQAASNKQEQEEDMDLLRQILESLMTLSFSQEDVMNRFTTVKDNDPYYVKLGKNQRRIMDDTRIVEDSLLALAQRQPKLGTFITKELNGINTNFDQGIENIDEHRRRQLSANLQFVMTGYNNLALMLNESLQQMQMQMNAESPGGGSCDKPGGKGSKPKEGDGDMKEMLKKQLEKMQKGEKEGSQPGKGKGEGMMGLGSKELARMAAQQTALRQKMEQLREKLNKEGKGEGNKLNPLINDLEKQERDLINKNFSKEMIKRQKDILTRLLESEKALLERGFEEKRESKVGKNTFLGNQKRIDEYNNQKMKQVELLRAVDPVFRKYYKDKASEYFNLVN